MFDVRCVASAAQVVEQYCHVQRGIGTQRGVEGPHLTADLSRVISADAVRTSSVGLGSLPMYSEASKTWRCAVMMRFWSVRQDQELNHASKKNWHLPLIVRKIEMVRGQFRFLLN